MTQTVMKTFFRLFFLAFFIPLIPLAQGYKTEKVSMFQTYFPFQPLPADYNTYTAHINAEGISFQYIKLNKPMVWVETGTKANYGSIEESERDFLTLHRYERVENEGDVNIAVEFTRPSVVNRELFTEECTFFENDQKVIRTCYYYKITYTFGAQWSVTDREGTVLTDSIHFDKDLQYHIWLGDIEYSPNLGAGSYTSKSELDANYQAKFEIDFFNTQITNFLKYCRRYLMNQYGFPYYTQQWMIATDKTSKKVNYDDLNQALSVFTEACSMIANEETKARIDLYQDQDAVVAYRSKLQEAIDVWETVLNEADYEDKKARIHRRLAPGIELNLGVAYFLMKDYDKSLEMIANASEHKHMSKEATKLKNIVTGMRSRYSINGIE